MDIDKTLQLVDKHAREYIVSIIGVFRSRDPSESQEDFLDPNNKIVIFGAISAFLGILLGHYALTRSLPDTAFYTEYFLKQVMYWTGTAFALFSVLWLTRRAIRLQDCISAVFRILPAAYVIGGFAGFIANDVAKIWSTPSSTWETAFKAIVVTQLVIVVLYTPNAVSRIPNIDRLGAWIGSIVVFTIVFGVQFLNWVEQVRRSVQ